jgi:hypothetical protein
LRFIRVEFGGIPDVINQDSKRFYHDRFSGGFKRGDDFVLGEVKSFKEVIGSVDDTLSLAIVRRLLI